MDHSMEAIPGMTGNTDGALFHHAEATCNGLSCTKYSTEKELNCVVCTKWLDLSLICYQCYNIFIISVVSVQLFR